MRKHVKRNAAIQVVGTIPAFAHLRDTRHMTRIEHSITIGAPGGEASIRVSVQGVIDGQWRSNGAIEGWEPDAQRPGATVTHYNGRNGYE